jgi:hypothetical protein
MGLQDPAGSPSGAIAVTPVQYLAFQDLDLIHTTTDFTLRTIAASTFSAAITPLLLRSATLSFVTGGTGGTRTLTLTAKYLNMRENLVTDILTYSQGISVTTSKETSDVVRKWVSVEVVAASGIVAADRIDIGYQWSDSVAATYKAIWWGVPAKCSGRRRDTVAGQVGMFVDNGDIVTSCLVWLVSGGVVAAGLGGADVVKNIRYDEARQAWRWNPGPPNNSSGIATFYDFTFVARP